MKSPPTLRIGITSIIRENVDNAGLPLRQDVKIVIFYSIQDKTLKIAIKN